MMNVSIGRPELIALCISIQGSGPYVSPLEFKDAFTKRPFVNGDHWRLNLTFLNEAPEEKLFELYSHYSQTIKKI